MEGRWHRVCSSEMIAMLPYTDAVQASQPRLRANASLTGPSSISWFYTGSEITPFGETVWLNECVTVLPYTLTLYPSFRSHYHYLPYLHHVETCTVRVHQCTLCSFVQSSVPCFIWIFAIVIVTRPPYTTTEPDRVRTFYFLSIQVPRPPRTRSHRRWPERYRYPLPTSLHSIHQPSNTFWPFSTATA